MNDKMRHSNESLIKKTKVLKSWTYVISLVIAIVATVPILLRTYQNFFVDRDNSILDLSNYISHERIKRDSIDIQYLKLAILARQLEHKISIMDSIQKPVDVNGIRKKLLYLEQSNLKIEQKVDFLRQSIDPSKPEEVLTIVRMKDQITALNSKVTDFIEHNKTEREAFIESVHRELSSSTQFNNAIMLALIPLIGNLFYNIWKDYRDRKQDSQKAKE